MFISFKFQDQSHVGMLLYYEDPCPFNPKRDFWPLSAVLRDDMRLFNDYEKLPNVKIIYFTRSPLCLHVLDGFLRVNGKAILFLGKYGEGFTVEKSPFEDDNLRCQREEFPFSSIPSLDEKQVKWRSKECYFKSIHGVDLLQSWIGALVLQSAKCIAQLIYFMGQPKNKRVELLLQEENAPDSMETCGSFERQTLIWCCWSIPKPKNLQKFLKQVLRSELDFNELHNTYSYVHPIHSGFYRVLVSDYSPEKKTVLLTWQNNPSFTYEVEISITEREVGRAYNFGPNTSGRVLFTVQNACVPYKYSASDSDIYHVQMNSLPGDCFYICSNILDKPCPYTPIYAEITSETTLQVFISQAICPCQELPINIFKAFQNQGRLWERLLWKNTLTNPE